MFFFCQNVELFSKICAYHYSKNLKQLYLNYYKKDSLACLFNCLPYFCINIYIFPVILISLLGSLYTGKPIDGCFGKN